jgi:hypothetical protein
MAGEPVVEQPKKDPATNTAAPEGTAKAPALEVETEDGHEDSGSVQQGMPGEDNTFHEGEDGVSANFNPETGELLDEIPETDEDGNPIEPKEATEGETAGDDDGGEKKVGDEAAQEAIDPASLGEIVEALPDYDPEKPEVQAQYDSRYFPEGKLNRDVIGQEFWQHFLKADPKDRKPYGMLPEGVYKYLEAETGLDRKTINEYEEGLVAKEANKATAASTALAERFAKVDGGKPVYDAATKWGREGGYTKEARDRFNALLAKGPSEDLDDSIDALVARYRKANPDAAARADQPQDGSRRRTRNQRRRSSPERTTAGAAIVPQGTQAAEATPAPEGYMKQADYKAAFDTAYAEKTKASAVGDHKAAALASKKLDELARLKNQRKIIYPPQKK